MELFLALIILAFIILLNLRWTWWRFSKKGLPVLIYHKIGYPPKNSKLKSLWVKPETFEKQVKYLNKHGYTTVLFSDILADFKGEKALPEKPALITFDDGYENNYTYAYKILKKLNAKGNIFVVYNTIGKANVWHNTNSEPWINMASIAMLKEMQDSGIIEFGAHTMNHPDLLKLPADMISWEIKESKKQLETALQTEICAFAYPYGAGAYNNKVRDKALEAGFTFDFSFKQGKTFWPWDRNSFPIDRLFIKGDENNFDLYLHLTRGSSRLI
ncbi:MAG: polysaccharide deacetylase family protein [Elusimicrobia bacterium]|nr:polysaccharide deacetylase family protein [Elusimicrobiota bacterium]